MRRVERVANLKRVVDHLIDAERPVIDSMIERVPFEQLHRDEWRALELVDLVDRADIRMIERRCRARFAHEALEHLPILGAARAQELERNGTTELYVFGAIYHAHAAFTQRLDHPVVRDRLSENVCGHCDLENLVSLNPDDRAPNRPSRPSRTGNTRASAG